MADRAAERDVPPPVLVIRPSRGWRALDLRELWSYRELLWIFAWRDLKVRYRQTVLGAVWVMGQPLITMLIFTFLFNRVARIHADAGTPYTVFVLAGLLVWNFFSNVIAAGANSLIGASYLISKIYFPRLIVPLAGTVIQLVDLGVAALLLGTLMVWYRVIPGVAIALLPLVIVIVAVLATGISFWAAALNVEYRDLRMLIPFVLQIGMYATPVVYPLSALPAKYRAIALVNPMTPLIEASRAMLFGTPVPAGGLVYATFVAFVVFLSGVYYFRRMERLFADLL
jgi:lipopolysaccharide transport system permease protein